jgi:hypothetical protein
MKAEAIEPPIDTTKIVMRAFIGTSTLASGLSTASPSENLLVSLSTGRAID